MKYHFIPAPRIVWTYELQFAAAADGWVIMRLNTRKNTPWLMDWSDLGQPSRFKTQREAIEHVNTQHGELYTTALAFIEQQNSPRAAAGAWEGICGNSNGLRTLLRERERARKGASVT